MALLARQIRALSTAPPEGVRLLPSEVLTDVLAELDGPVGTPYEGGTFVIKLVLGADYPAAPPKGACSGGRGARAVAAAGARRAARTAHGASARERRSPSRGGAPAPPRSLRPLPRPRRP